MPRRSSQQQPPGRNGRGQRTRGKINPIFNYNIIAITGHREYPDRGALFRGLDQLRAKTYYLGGARGTDTDALEYLARTQPSSRRIVVVPNRLIDQPRATIPIISRDATEIIELRNTGPDRYMIRNRYLVDRSQHLRAFYDLRGAGGTFNTLEYARSTGKSHSITVMLEQDLNKYLELSTGEFLEFILSARANGVLLTNLKGIITSYYNQKVGFIPSSVVELLRSW